MDVSDKHVIYPHRTFLGLGDAPSKSGPSWIPRTLVRAQQKQGLVNVP